MLSSPRRPHHGDLRELSTQSDVASEHHLSHKRGWALGTTGAMVLLYAFATLQFIRFYVVSATFYLNLPAYLTGRERLPFQYRILPALLIRGFYKVHLLHAGAMHTKGAFTAERAPLYLVSLLGMVLAGLFTQAAYNAISSRRSLPLLVYPVFLFTMMWTYAIHTEANFSYPYDMLSVAFFAAGLFCIVKGNFLGLLLVVALGTWNRETTLFLLGIFAIDGASMGLRHPTGRWGDRFSLRQIPWLKLFLLAAVWLSIKLWLAHHYAGNDRSEDYVRLRENLGELKPRLWPALLNFCGFMLPVVLLFRRYLQPLRFRNYLWIVPLWFAAMFYAGVIVETRIFGELCPYVAIALVLIIENRAGSPASPSTEFVAAR